MSLSFVVEKLINKNNQNLGKPIVFIDSVLDEYQSLVSGCDDDVKVMI